MLVEPTLEEDHYAQQVIGAAIEVHRLLGPGYLEKIYEEALAIELNLRSIPFKRQKQVSVNYKGSMIGEGYVDFLIGDRVVVELKTVDSITETHHAQVISYLKATGCCIGLLLNFKSAIMKDGIRRIVYSG